MALHHHAGPAARPPRYAWNRRLGQLNYADGSHLPHQHAGPALVLAHFAPLLPKQARPAGGALSQGGAALATNAWSGWYMRYRASKAALNMLVETPPSKRSATHPAGGRAGGAAPGTVNSALSAPFNGAKLAVRRRMRRATCWCWMGSRLRRRAASSRLQGAPPLASVARVLWFDNCFVKPVSAGDAFCSKGMPCATVHAARFFRNGLLHAECRMHPTRRPTRSCSPPHGQAAVSSGSNSTTACQCNECYLIRRNLNDNMRCGRGWQPLWQGSCAIRPRGPFNVDLDWRC